MAFCSLKHRLLLCVTESLANIDSSSFQLWTESPLAEEFKSQTSQWWNTVFGQNQPLLIRNNYTVRVRCVTNGSEPQFGNTFRGGGKNGYWLCDRRFNLHKPAREGRKKKRHKCALQKNRADHSWKEGKPFNQVLEIQAAGSQNILVDFKLFAFNNNFQVCKLFRSALLVQLLQHFCRTEKTDSARVPIKSFLFLFFTFHFVFVKKQRNRKQLIFLLVRLAQHRQSEVTNVTY